MLEKLPANRFLRRLQRSILSHYRGRLDVANFIYAVDDTDNPKYANLSSVSHWSGSKGKYFGQKILVLALVDERQKFALPLAFKYCQPKKVDGQVKAPKLAIELMKEILAAGFPCLPLATDSWFDSKEFAADCEEMGIRLVWELKSNRKARANPSPHVSNTDLQSLFRDMKRKILRSEKKSKRKWYAQLRILISGRRSYLNSIAVYNRRNGREAFAFYATTDLQMSGARIWRVSRARWAIECLFRDLKQNLNFGRFQSGKQNAVDLAVIMPFLIVTMLRLSPKSLSLPPDQTIGCMLHVLRNRALDRSLDLILSNPTNPRLANLRFRRAQHGRKPRVSRCGSEEGYAMAS
jgi:hypothetical protein